MDWHEYVTGELVGQRLAELRTAATRARLARAGAATPSPLRVAVGRALIRFGTRIAGTMPATAPRIANKSA